MPLSFALVVALGSCSSVYDLQAIVIDGKLAFLPVDKDFWGDPEPDCFYSISVQAADLPSTTSGDGTGSAQGVYWNQTFAVTSCDNRFPVFYGAPLKGPSSRENYEYNVRAQPLRRDLVYEVSASSNGSRYGGGKFLLTENGAVRNLSL